MRRDPGCDKAIVATKNLNRKMRRTLYARAALMALRSSLTAGPIVEHTVPDTQYFPFAPDGRFFSTALTTARRFSSRSLCWKDAFPIGTWMFPLVRTDLYFPSQEV